MRIYLYNTKNKPLPCNYFDSPLVPVKGDVITIIGTPFVVVKRELVCNCIDLQLNIVRVYVSLIEENGNNV